VEGNDRVTAAHVATKEPERLPGTDGPAPPRALSDRLPHPWLFPLAVFAVTWLLIVEAWDISDAIKGRHRHPWTWHFMIMDGTHYERIAHWGYAGDATKGAFFPLFPLLIHAATYLTAGDYVIAGLLTAVACGAASAVAVWALAERVRDRHIADRAVMLYCLFPGAMTFGLLYTEPLAVALAAAALLALLNRKWLLAGIIGALGTAERSTLIVLFVVAAITAAQAIWARREWRSLIAPALTPLGMLIFFSYEWRHYGNFFYWFAIEQNIWHQHFDWGSTTFRELLGLAPVDPNHKLFLVMLIVMFLTALAGIALMLAARLPLALTLFATLTILLAITSSNGGTKPRFIWTAFPIFIAAAAKLPRYRYWPALLLSAAGLALMVGGWRYLFGFSTPP
jgi:Gpi18-like mannosyltransferase